MTPFVLHEPRLLHLAWGDVLTPQQQGISHANNVGGQLMRFWFIFAALRSVSAPYYTVYAPTLSTIAVTVWISLQLLPLY